MPRKLKGWGFEARYKGNYYEEQKAINHYKNWYGEDNVKVMEMVNQYGRGYTDIYLREGARRCSERGMMIRRGKCVRARRRGR